MRIPGLPLDSEMAAELYCDEVLTGDGHLIRLDRYRSVSGLVLVRDTLAQMADKVKVRPEGGPHGS